MLFFSKSTITSSMHRRFNDRKLHAFVDLFGHISYKRDPVANWLRALTFHNHNKSFDHLNAVSDVGSSPTRATCETSQVLLAGVPGAFFLGLSRFRHTY